MVSVSVFLTTLARFSSILGGFPSFLLYQIFVIFYVR